MYVYAQKNERLTHLFMRIFFFPDFHVVVIFFYVHVQKITLIPPPHTLLLMMRQIKQSATNQAMNKLNKLSDVYHIRQMKLAMCSKLDRSYNM